MRGEILKHWRIVASTLFSVVLIIGAFMLARSVESPPYAQASTESALLQAIATKDSDNDGLPDWEETLYGTDPHNPDTFHLGMTDGAAVAKGLIVPKAVANIPVATSTPGGMIVDPSLPPAPADGTLTAAFARSFFSLYLAAKQANGGADLSESDMSNIANQAVASLSASIAPAPDFKSLKDLTVSGSGPDALKAFAVNAEAVLAKNANSAAKGEIDYLKAALMDNDATALSNIALIAKTYRDSAVGLAVLPVPSELASADLALVNAMMRMSEITTDFARANTDPLATLLALQQYPPAASALATAFSTIDAVYAASGVVLASGTPGASFVNLMQIIATEQQTAAKKP